MTDKLRLPIVDGLRAIAVIAVVLFHAFPGLVWGGFVGVDIFFVISGFVITLRYLDPLITGEITFTTFFARRIRRLLPAYLVFVAATSVIAAWLLSPRHLVDFGISLASQAIYAQNVAFWHLGDYFDSARVKPLLHTWTLAVEEQFYLCFPIMILLFRRNRRTAVGLLLLAALVSIATGYIIGPISPKTSFYWLPFRAWEFLAGIFAAMLFQRGAFRQTSPALNSAAVAAGTAAVFVAILAFGDDTIFPGLQNLFAVTGTTAVCLFQRGAAGWIAGLYTNRLSQHWGRISYSWYLWHWPPLSFYFVVEGHPPAPGTAAILTATGYALGALSWQIVERWGLRTPRLRHWRPAAGLLMVFLIVAAVSGTAIVANGGFVERYPPQQRALLKAQMDVASYRCTLWRRLADWDEDMCRLNDAAGSGGVLIMGDSHADQAKGVVAALGDSAGVPVYLVKQNCRLIDYGRKFNCPMSHWAALMSQARKHGVTKLVLIAYWPQEFDPDLFRASFDRLSASGLQIFLQQSAPEGPMFDPATYLNRPEDWSGRSGYPAAQYRTLRGRQADAFSAFADSNPLVTILDPVELLCASGDCVFSLHGEPLYLDAHHLNSAGVRLLLPIYRRIFWAHKIASYGASRLSWQSAIWMPV